MNKNLLFLDIDGVLNNLGSVLALGSPSHHLDPVSVALIARLLTEADAKVVISSSWRIGRTVESLKQELDSLRAHKIADRIIARTGDGHKGHRGRQIKEWIALNAPGCHYCIVDDDSDMLPEQKPYFVKTNFEDGFRAAHYKKAIEIFLPQHADSKIVTMGEYAADMMPATSKGSN